MIAAPPTTNIAPQTTTNTCQNPLSLAMASSNIPTPPDAGDESVIAETPQKAEKDTFSKLCQEKYYQFQQLGERKVWYSDAALAYNDYRPKYPKPLLREAAQHIKGGNKVLEVGSGPGTASVPLAEFGYQLHCIEPNADFCDVCRENVQTFGKQVKVETVSLEEARLKDGSYDAVVAATSIHWIPFDTAFIKCAAALKPQGTLVLLWNMTMFPTVPQVMERIIDVHTQTFSSIAAASSDANKDHGKFSLWHFWKTGSDPTKLATDVEAKLDASALFDDYRTGHTTTKVRYSAEEFVGVLSTYSPYIRLTETVRNQLFTRLIAVINSEMNGTMDMTFHSVYNVATKKKS